MANGNATSTIWHFKQIGAAILWKHSW